MRRLVPCALALLGACTGEPADDGRLQAVLDELRVELEAPGALGATTVLDRSPVEWGAGGLAAPAEESIRFLRALLRGEILTRDSMTELTEFRPTPPLGIVEEEAAADEGSGYGLGLVRMERSGIEIVGHGGLFTGHTAGAWHLPDCDVTIALYFNRGFVGQRRVLDRVLPIVTRAPDGASSCR